jgi:peptide/nickel transport system permease protein
MARQRVSQPALLRRRLLAGFLRSWKGAGGIAIVLGFTLMPLLQPLLSPYSPLEIGVGPPDAPPSAGHPLGTTRLGQDVLSQFLAGGQVSVIVGLLTGLFASLFAIVMGIPAGYYSGPLGLALTMITDIFLVFPILPLIIIFAAYLGPSLENQILILALLTWPFAARVIRAQVLSLRQRAFVASAQLAGASDLRIMFGEILPNVMPLVLSNGVLIIVFAILFQAAINFLGLGDPTSISWGTMLYMAQLSGAVASGEWWWVVPPGLGIASLAFGFSLIVLRLDELFTQWAAAGRR